MYVQRWLTQLSTLYGFFRFAESHYTSKTDFELSIIENWTARWNKWWLASDRLEVVFNFNNPSEQETQQVYALVTIGKRWIVYIFKVKLTYNKEKSLGYRFAWATIDMFEEWLLVCRGK